MSLRVSLPVDWYYDADGDGYGDASDPLSSCEALAGYSRTGDDCDDTNAAVNPGAAEVCDGGDEDCDGLEGGDDPGVTDEPTWYYDADGDGYGDAGASAVNCTAPRNYLADGTDCDDTSESTNPGATEVCDSVDANCNGVTDDEEASDRTSWYADADADGYGDATSATLACSAPASTVEDASDCDDADATVSPAATEICENGVDDNCDGGSGSCHASGDVDAETEAIATIHGDVLNTYLAYQVAAGDIRRRIVGRRDAALPRSPSVRDRRHERRRRTSRLLRLVDRRKAQRW